MLSYKHTGIFKNTREVLGEVLAIGEVQVVSSFYKTIKTSRWQYFGPKNLGQILVSEDQFLLCGLCSHKVVV